MGMNLFICFRLLAESYICDSRIMQDIAPEPTQFPAANLVLDYYKMSRIDVWEYFQKSNGFKSCRDVWFMSEPIGEVWVPLGFGAKRFRDWGMICRIGDKFKVQMNGFINVNRHSFPVFPYCIAPYLRKDEHSRFSTATGFIYDLGDYPAVHGLMGRAIIDFGMP
ncbi:hypothetical protein FACS1894188_07250 [Clostridia bacterium]|nr:hypothetical protein FACS1894188_07250 [Clostridia bacterium]